MEKLHEKKININGNKISKYNLNIGSYNTNKKITVYETETEILLKSYESFILIYDKLTETIIYDYETYKISVTTRKHLYEFEYFLKWIKGYEIKQEIYLTEYNFYKNIEENFLNFGNCKTQIQNIIKLYELEKKHINYYLDLEQIKTDLYLFENVINSTNKDNQYIKGLEIVNIIKKELKTRNKYLIGLRYSNEEIKHKIDLVITLTYNKNKTKLLKIKSELTDKIGLSFNNYNTKELDQYTNYNYY